MPRRIPPLNHLRAFEAAARHLSFRAAADELSVTHAAVSHQIRALEERFGTRLFNRVTRGVTLTDDAEKLAVVLTRALDDIDAGVREFQSMRLGGTVRVSAVPWYVSRVLLPNIDALYAVHPDLKVEFDFSYELANFQTDGLDAALRHGLGKWPGLSAIRIHHDLLSPLCGPTLVKGRNLPLTPEEIAELPLTAARGYEHVWVDWFDAVGQPELKPDNIMIFDNRALATEFAGTGNGVSLSDVPTDHDDLKAGRLVRLHPKAIQQDTGAHLVFPDGPFTDPRLERIADWMHDCFAALPVDWED
jgi:DNA-binding transcriptional LysR family regulator